MTESSVVRLVVALLGAIALLSLGLLGALALLERDGSEVLVAALSATGTTALGALASMLVSTRSVDPAPTPQQAERLAVPGDGGYYDPLLVGILVVLILLLLVVGGVLRFG